jgi:hydrogenase-4 membrane subunit HyfE
MSAWEDAENVIEAMLSVNEITGTQVMTVMLMVTTFMVIFMAVNKKNSTVESAMASGFAMSIITLFLLVAQVSTITWFIAFTSILAGSLYALYKI